MPIKVSNLRLELEESEDQLPEKIAGRLGLPRDAIVHWRILRKSLDARGHDDIHFSYAATVDLGDDEACADQGGRGVIPDLRAGAVRLAASPARSRCGTAPSSSAPGRPGSSRVTCWHSTATTP